MPRITFVLGIAGMQLIAFACASGPRAAGQVARPATDAPERFLVRDAGELRPARAGEGCRNPMVDPRDRAELRLDRSEGGAGDYEVPPGRYGVRKGERLRLDCATGAALGIVRAQS